jgi:bifunctional UDP-N-acetylglucosamine pyrophosphorylase/glucosamine-1-phosphate N-acetyltransferase
MISIAILSAGKGTRMKSQKAKVLHKMGGKPILYHIVKEAKKISDDITIVIGHQGEAVQKEMSSHFSDLKFLEQDLENFSGTGGALKSFKPTGKKTLVLNGDMPLVRAEDLEKIVEVDASVTMTSLKLENPSGYGRVIQNNDEVIKIVEEKDCSEEEKLVKTVNAGVYLFDSEFLTNSIPKLSSENAQNEYYITDLIAIAKSENFSVKSVLVSEESFMGVNSKLQLSEAEKIHLNRIRENLMKNGVTMHLPETIYIEESVKFIGECEVEQNSSIYGNTTIEKSVVKAGSVIEDSNIKNSTIGVMAHIRPNSNISDSKVGNFVEVKKSTLKGVKAGHLAYLGDSEIDEGTNIGAGVITANYDGKNKYKTLIGKNVFVGSDSQIIAPVEIPDEVMIGAGSTVPPNSKIEKGSLAISRSKLKNIPNFFYKFFKK